MSVQLDRALIRDPFTWPLRLMIAVIVFVAGTGLMAAWTLTMAAAEFDRGLSGQLTVELPPADNGKPDPARAAALLKDIASAPGVMSAAPLTQAQMTQLLRPWLGKDASLEALPLPQLIDVRVQDSAASADLAALLAKKYPEAGVNDHRLWVERLAAMVERAAALLFAIVLALLAALGGTVMFACRAGLAVHKPIVELLHVIGAPDAHICRQMRLYAWRLVWPASLLGLAACVLAAAALAASMRELQFANSSGTMTTFWAGNAILAALLPLMAVMFAWLGAHSATRRILLAMP
ncbi:MAG: hypothetical protein WDO70_03845 [Alphaproteobacteria bacterium]